jgi:GTP-binding protein EngB required for normal cell division
MLKREEERSRQWMESEKETLHVLNGVSNLLDLSEKIEGVRSEKILESLKEFNEEFEKIQTKLEKIIQSKDKTLPHDENRSTEGGE